MARSARSDGASALALQAGSAATPARFTADDLGVAGPTTALERLNAALGELKALSVQPLLQQAADALNAGDHAQGSDWALKALEKDERSGLGWYMLAVAREMAGDFRGSITCYEAALKLLPDHAEITNNLGRLAFRLGQIELAEQLFRHFLANFPNHPEGANNLACALRDQGRYDEAFDLLKACLTADPGHAMVWNTLGTVMAEQGDMANALIFFDEALRLDPGLSKARYNRGNMRLALGHSGPALEDCDQALAETALEHERLMMRLSRSTILINLGRVGEGWDEYEARLDPNFADVTQFAVGRPAWTPGDDLAGKSLLLVGEQGLGDEILFANILPDLLDRLGPEGRLTLAVESRLVPLFQRSFPTARVGAHATFKVEGKTVRTLPFLAADLAGVDLWAPLASPLRELRRSADAFPDRARFMAADPARVAYWKTQVQAAGSGPKVGLLWKSAVTSGARRRYFSPFQQWAPVLAAPQVRFINLQYGDCAPEIEAARRDMGVDIWTPPGIDLKQDLDDVAALCCALDLVLGFSNATFNLAAACGASAWLISTPGAWPRLGSDRYPWYPQARVFLPAEFGDWDGVMTEIGASLADWAQAQAPSD